MEKRPTIVDVARLAGVSAATVSNAINNSRYVGAGTKLRIDAAVAQLGYTPNVHARRMRRPGIGTIGLFSSMPFAVSGKSARLGFLMELAATAAVSALDGGFALLLVPSMPDELPPLDELAIDGAIVVEPDTGDPFVEQLRTRAIPLVTVGKQPGAPAGAAAVDLRSADAAQLLVDHLRAMSSTRIALITGTARRNSYIESESAYAMLARSHGMDPVIVRIEERGGEEAAYAATVQLMREHSDLDGIVALVDTFAAGAIRALRDLDIAVPNRVRVATRYDGNRARESTPPITALDLQLEVVARLAVTLVLDQLRTGAPGGTVLAPPAMLVARASTEAHRP